MRRAVFLDRDGVLVDTIERPEFEKKITAPFKYKELKFAPNLLKAMRIMDETGYLRIIITNQPDVAYGYMEEATWKRIHNEVLGRVRPHDCYLCRHRRQDNCPIRKPAPTMILVAADRHDVDLNKSFMVGDTADDMNAGKLAGCRTVLIRKRYNQEVTADFYVDSLLEAAELTKSYANY